MRLIVRARELKKQCLKNRKFVRNWESPREYVVKKTLETGLAATRCPRIKQVYQQLLDADIAIKTGKYPEELALNILIAELCQRAPVAAQR